VRGSRPDSRGALTGGPPEGTLPGADTHRVSGETGERVWVVQSKRGIDSPETRCDASTVPESTAGQPNRDPFEFATTTARHPSRRYPPDSASGLYSQGLFIDCDGALPSGPDPRDPSLRTVLQRVVGRTSVLRERVNSPKTRPFSGSSADRFTGNPVWRVVMAPIRRRSLEPFHRKPGVRPNPVRRNSVRRPTRLPIRFTGTVVCVPDAPPRRDSGTARHALFTGNPVWHAPSCHSPSCHSPSCHARLVPRPTRGPTDLTGNAGPISPETRCGPCRARTLLGIVSHIERSRPVGTPKSARAGGSQ
jgi:hypothetical protein